MKTIFISILVFVQSCFCFSQTMVDSLYLGKTFPGETPLVFLAGITERIAISSDGKEIFYNSSNGLGYYHYADTGWNGPDALFIGFGEASLSLNDSILYAQNSQNDSYYSLKNDTGWSQPVKLWNNNSASKHQLQVTNSGTFYATVSPQLSTRGDISKILIDGSDISFESLPFPINSTLNGVDFYMAKDESYLIFPEIISGAGDLYISYKKTNTTWTNPKSIGSLINTTDWEYGPYVSPDNKYLFFSRSTASATYWVKIGGMIDSLKHTNFVPYVKTRLGNQTDSLGHSYSLTIPDTTFVDDDSNNTLSYSATLSNNNPLPAWLLFNAESATFSGTLDSIGTFIIKVTATDTANASVSTSFTLNVVGNPTSVFNPTFDENFQVYPNPARDMINISFGSMHYKTALVKITDISGKLISTDTYHNLPVLSVNLSVNPKGFYLVSINIDGIRISKKICLE
jgi:hypothetical protein